MSKRRLIALALLLVLVVGAALLAAPRGTTQVVGTLAEEDRKQILRLVQQDFRNRVLPDVEWETLFYPRYVMNCIKEYHGQRILWMAVRDDGAVEVFAGQSKQVIRDEGYSWILRKAPEWKITGGAYWGSPGSAFSTNIQIPPD